MPTYGSWPASQTDDEPQTDRDVIVAEAQALADDPTFPARLAEELAASRRAAAVRRDREAANGGRPLRADPAELSKQDLRERLRAVSLAAGIGEDR